VLQTFWHNYLALIFTHKKKHFHLTSGLWTPPYPAYFAKQKSRPFLLWMLFWFISSYRETTRRI